MFFGQQRLRMVHEYTLSQNFTQNVKLLKCIQDTNLTFPTLHELVLLQFHIVCFHLHFSNNLKVSKV